MPPKRSKALSRGRGRGKLSMHQPSKPSPPPEEQQDQLDQHVQSNQPDQCNQPANDSPPTSRSQSREPRSPTPPSREGSVDSVASNSTSQPNQLQAKKRAKKIVFSLNAEQEESMLEFLQVHPMIWDCKLSGYRRTDLKAKLWEDQGASMEPPIKSQHLQGWFKSLRDTHTRLHKKKSGDGAPGELTERELWIKNNFDFLNSVIRHRPEPCKSVKATIEEHQGDLCAAETACVEVGVALDDENMPTVTKGKGKRLQEDREDALLTSLQKRVQQSGELLASLQPAAQQPVTTRTAFANYVRDSLISMGKPKFKKARSAINCLLSELMAEDSEDDIPSAGPSMPSANMGFIVPQVRPRYGSYSSSSRASKSPYPSSGDQYQPAPQMWKPQPPQASVWASQSQEYMDSYWQEQPQQQQHTSTSVASAIGSASQTLTPLDTSLVGSLNQSNTSNISGSSDLSDMIVTNTELNTRRLMNSDRDQEHNS